jgi:hypothetical protein
MKKIVSLISLILLFYSCNGSNNPPIEIVQTKLSVLDVSHERSSKQATLFRFYINISTSSSKDITVDYKTGDISAIAGKDYTAVSGTLTILANQTIAYIDVFVSRDSLRQADQTFYIEISTPTNAVISGTGKAIGTIINNGTYYPTDSTGFTSPLSYPGYTLVWNDEFNGSTINTNDWNFETGGSGWGNNELEYYTNSTKNAYLSNGNLVIEAKKETMGTNNYTSARMNTAGKKTFQYGRIDIRAKVPVAAGLWPALWMLGSNISTVGWPTCGETDIMELVGSSPNRVVGSIHWAQANGSSGTYNNAYFLSSGDFSQQFHVFSLIWKQNYIQILVDGIAYVTATNSSLSSGSWPFNSPSFLIFNVAVGGDWPGAPPASTTFPQRMFVDYIRVFQ